MLAVLAACSEPTDVPEAVDLEAMSDDAVTLDGIPQEVDEDSNEA